MDCSWQYSAAVTEALKTDKGIESYPHSWICTRRKKIPAASLRPSNFHIQQIHQREKYPVPKENWWSDLNRSRALGTINKRKKK